jgi:hypothetical protein
MLFGMFGCSFLFPRELKPKIPEEYILPPSDDARFSSPPAYPKDSLDSGTLKKDREPGKAMDPSSSRGPGGLGTSSPYGGRPY